MRMKNSGKDASASNGSGTRFFRVGEACGRMKDDVLPSAAIGNTFSAMKTMTVKLPDELAARLEKRAKRLGVSKSALVRESVDRAMTETVSTGEQPSMYDLVKDDLGCVDSGLSDLSTHPKHMKGFGR